MKIECLRTGAILNYDILSICSEHCNDGKCPFATLTIKTLCIVLPIDVYIIKVRETHNGYALNRR